MAGPHKHFFACRNRREDPLVGDSRDAPGAEGIYNAFRKFRKKAGIADEILLSHMKCSGKCRCGPNPVVHPGNMRYYGLNVDDVGNTVGWRLLNNRPREDKMLNDDLIRGAGHDLGLRELRGRD